MGTAPLAGRRQTKVTERRTKTDWARFLGDIAPQYWQFTTDDARVKLKRL